MSEKLRFTGNWFIDLGILGFVNLMEEVYGWDLEKLKERLLKEERLIYYGFFPLAYMYKWLKDRSYKDRSYPISIEIPEEEHLEKLQEKEAHEIFEEVWWRWVVPMFKNLWISKKLADVIEKGKIPPPETGISSQAKEVVSKVKEIVRLHGDEIKKILRLRKSLKGLDLAQIEKLKIESNISSGLKLKIDQLSSSIERIKEILISCFNEVLKERKMPDKKVDKFYRLSIDSGFFKNYLFFNQSTGLIGQKTKFLKIIDSHLDDIDLKMLTKSINKLFPSFDEFPNEFFTHFSSKNINIERLFTFLINFPYAFNRISGINITFYSNSLEFSYLVNKKIKLLIQKTDSRDNIFRLTWKGIIDVLYEHKVSWALENMYLIQYRRLDNKVQEDVEYLGITKLKAELLADDKIRDTVNFDIKISDKGNKTSVWLLEELLKGKPLIPIFHKSLNLYFSAKSNKPSPYVIQMIYAAAIDKALKDYSSIQEPIFSTSFFRRPKTLRENVKNYVNRYFELKRVTSNLFKHLDHMEREGIAYRLFSSIKQNRPYLFTNILLKELNKIDRDPEKLLKHAFRNILNNHSTWQSDAIPILAGLISKGGEG